MIPDVVTALAGSDQTKLAWRNDLGGLTFRVAEGTARDRYIKWVAAGTPEIDLAAEAQRLAWASRWVTVPQVLESGLDDSGSWLVTRSIAATSAIDDRWRGEPRTVVAAIGRGLRTLHDTLPVDECPFAWTVRPERFEERIEAGEGPADWSPAYRSLTVEEARSRLADRPSIDRLVVCHGDACVPNVLLDAAGTFVGHVDLGSLGRADRWADIAVAAWSLERNFGPGHEVRLCREYGIEPDAERLAYYWMLWDLC